MRAIVQKQQQNCYQTDVKKTRSHFRERSHHESKAELFLEKLNTVLHIMSLVCENSLNVLSLATLPQHPLTGTAEFMNDYFKMSFSFSMNKHDRLPAL